MIWNSCSFNGFKVFNHLPSESERMEAYKDMAAMILEQMGRERIGITHIVQEAENQYCMHWTVIFACDRESIETSSLAFQKALNEGNDLGEVLRDEPKEERKHSHPYGRLAIIGALFFLLGFLTGKLIRFLYGF